MESVRDFYSKVKENEGKEIADKFVELLTKFEDGKSVLNSYYKEDLLQSILEEAKKEKYSVKAYKFSKTALSEKPDILNAKTPEEFLKEKYNGVTAFGIENLQTLGQYRIRGWSFDFTPFMKQYVVKQYGSWQEYWAPNKTLLRKSIYGTIDKIVEISK